MRALFVNYNYAPTWLLTSDLDYHILDRSDSAEYLKGFPPDRITYTKNIGNVDYDKLLWLVDNYDNLPPVFVWAKSNLFKYISLQEWEELRYNDSFTPLLTQFHTCYTDEQGWVNYYENEIYHERNNSWYLNTEHRPRYIETFNDWAKIHGLPQNLHYLPFAPGGNYILTRENVHKYSRDYYENMASMLDWTQLPGEAQCAERSYYLMWR